MAILRARKVASVPTPTQASTIYIVDTSNVKEKHIYITDDANVNHDLGIKSGYMVNKKLLAAA